MISSEAAVNKHLESAKLTENNNAAKNGERLDYGRGRSASMPRICLWLSLSSGKMV